jgi:hypothetical protein
MRERAVCIEAGPRTSSTMPRSIRTSAPRTCWRQRVIAGEPDRALRVYGDVIGMDAGEDSQFATAERIALLTELGRTGEADAEMTRLGRSHVHPRPGRAGRGTA